MGILPKDGRLLTIFPSSNIQVKLIKSALGVCQKTGDTPHVLVMKSRWIVRISMDILCSKKAIAHRPKLKSSLLAVWHCPIKLCRVFPSWAKLQNRLNRNAFGVRTCEVAQLLIQHVKLSTPKVTIHYICIYIYTHTVYIYIYIQCIYIYIDSILYIYIEYLYIHT